jgi:hypothetical protein
MNIQLKVGSLVYSGMAEISTPPTAKLTALRGETLKIPVPCGNFSHGGNPRYVEV